MPPTRTSPDPLAAYKAKDAWWTPSNIISFVRVLLTVPAVYFLYNGYYHATAVVCVLAFLSDIADGYIARKTNDVSEVGKIIDPLADKIFIAVAGLTMLLLKLLPLWFVAVVVGRDLLIMAVGVWATKRFHVVLPSNYPGKLAALVIALTLFMTLLEFSQDVLLFMQGLSLLLMLISVAVYGKRLLDLLQKTANT